MNLLSIVTLSLFAACVQAAGPSGSSDPANKNKFLTVPKDPLIHHGDGIPPPPPEDEKDKDAKDKDAKDATGAFRPAKGKANPPPKPAIRRRAAGPSRELKRTRVALMAWGQTCSDAVARRVHRTDRICKPLLEYGVLTSLSLYKLIEAKLAPQVTKTSADASPVDLKMQSSKPAKEVSGSYQKGHKLNGRVPHALRGMPIYPWISDLKGYKIPKGAVRMQVPINKAFPPPPHLSFKVVLLIHEAETGNEALTILQEKRCQEASTLG
ncbi:hypothetical protein F5887DRAFT_922044 [Amanita rubescens]|nr:hypothetical protein F5887DRAFT_922044 [Amanita rubescens]